MPRKLNSRGAARGLFNMKRRARAAGGDGQSDRSDYRQQIQARKGAGKKGCSSKLFMLALPVMAVGTYLFLVLGS